MEIKEYGIIFRLSPILLAIGYDFSDYIIGGLAQLARAPALHAGGQRFESVILHTFYCSVAMMITHQSTMTEQEIFDILNTQQVDSCFHPSQDEMRIQRIIQVTKQR